MEENDLSDMQDNSYMNEEWASRNEMAPLDASKLSDTVRVKLLKVRKGVAMNRLLLALKDNNPARVDNIINFEKFGKALMDSTMPIKAAIESGNFELATQLHSAGFKASEILILESIERKDENIVTNMLSHGFYSRQNVEITFWYLLKSNFLDLAEKLYLKEDTLQAYCTLEEISNPVRVENLIHSQELLEKVFDQALDLPSDTVACLVLQQNHSLISHSRVSKAFSNSCLNFLKILCTGDIFQDPEQISAKLSRSALWDTMEQRVGDNANGGNIIERVKVAGILQYYLSKNMYAEARRVLKWPMAKNSLKIFKILCNCDSEDLIKEFLDNSKFVVHLAEFCIALESKRYEVCRSMLGLMSGRLDISSRELQEQLLAMLENGETSLLAIDIICRISPQAWNYQLTKPLCLKLEVFAKKRLDLYSCEAPILFCVLVAEVMQRLSSKKQFEGRCLDLQDTFLDLAVCIQDSFNDDDSLKYLMTQRDSQKRPALKIIAEKKFYKLLENDQVGIIVTKMWVGTENYYGIDKASSIVNSFSAPFGSKESKEFMLGIDLEKPYVFQYHQWTQACTLRFFAFSLSVLFLLIIYQILIYTAVSKNEIQGITNGRAERGYLLVIYIWVFGIDCEQILKYLFARKTNRKFKMDTWVIVDLLVSVLIIVITIDLPNKYAGPGNYFSHADPFLLSALLHTVMIVLLTLKYLSLLLTSKSFGPFLSMVLLIFKQVITFFVIYFGFTLCTAAVFTLFFNSMPTYSRVDYSLQTLFMATIGPFTITNFNYTAFGPLMLAVYLLLAHILLLNLLVGIITNVFNGFQQQVESEYCSIIIKTYYKEHWDDSYGMMIFMPTPVTALSLVLSPWVLFSKNPEYWNNKISKFLHLVYAVPQFCVFLMWGMLYWLPLYFKGFIIYGKATTRVSEYKSIQIFQVEDNGEEKEVEKFFFTRSLAWTVVGVYKLSFAFFRDCYHFWKLALFSDGVQIEDNENNILDDNFIKNVQITIKSIKAEKVTVSELFNSWYFFDKLTNEDHSDERKLNAMNFFKQFANPKDKNSIDIAEMQKIITKRVGHQYDETYKQRLQYFNRLALTRAMISFHRKIGMGKALRQMKLENQEGSKAFDTEIEKLEGNISELKPKLASLAKQCRKYLRDSS